MNTKQNPSLLVKLGIETLELRRHLPASAFIQYRLTPDKKHLRSCGYDFRRAALNGHQPLPQQQQKQGATPTEKTRPPKESFKTKKPPPKHGDNSEKQPRDEPKIEVQIGAKASGIKPPELDSIAYHGPVGSIVEKMEPESEANKPSLLVQALVCVGNLIGRNAYTKVGNATRKHYASLFSVTVGTTSIGRKGTGLDLLKAHVFPSIDDEIWRNKCIANGASSGTGIVFHLRNATEKDPGAEDKLLLLEETEFGNVLNVIKREGNDLSGILRKGWDGDPLGNLSMKNRDEQKSFMRASEYHLSINGHITRFELRAKLFENETANGLFNRILWVYSERSRLLPSGGNFKTQDIKDEIIELIRGVEFASQRRSIRRDEKAEARWRDFYFDFAEQVKDDNYFNKIVSRGDAQTMRLSLLFAALDCSPVIRVDHINAAIAVWNYCFESARWAFCNTRFTPKAQRIYDFLDLRPSGQATLSILSTELFKGHTPAAGIREAIDELQNSQVVRIFANFKNSKSKKQFTVEIIA